MRFTKTKTNTKKKTNTKTIVSWCRLVLSRLVNVVEASRARSVNVRFTKTKTNTKTNTKTKTKTKMSDVRPSQAQLNWYL